MQSILLGLRALVVDELFAPPINDDLYKSNQQNKNLDCSSIIPTMEKTTTHTSRTQNSPNILNIHNIHNIQNIQNIQNKNYGNLIYNKIKFWICDSCFFLSFFRIVKLLDCWKCVWVLLVCFVLQIVIFNAFIGFRSV